MSETLRCLLERIMLIISVIVFVILFIVGLFIFSYFLIIGTFISLILLFVSYVDLRIDQHKRQKEFSFSKIIEHNETEEK